MTHGLTDSKAACYVCRVRTDKDTRRGKIMTVRERVAAGRSVRVNALADEVGLPASTLYAWVRQKKLEAIRYESAVLIPAAAARPLLGMVEATEPVAA